MRAIWTDIRYGLRMLAASPGFTAVAILSLAIGIGANTSTFSLADAMFLRPLTVPRSSEIVRVFSTSAAERFGPLSYPDYVDIRDQAKTVSGLLACKAVPAGFSKDPKSPARPRLALAVSTNFFDVIGMQPALGRAFRSDEGQRPVMIISEQLWRSEFGGDPSAVGRTVSLSKVNFTVIGVAPKKFSGLERFVHEDSYIPLGVESQITPQGRRRIRLKRRLGPSRTIWSRPIRQPIVGAEPWR